MRLEDRSLGFGADHPEEQHLQPFRLLYCGLGLGFRVFGFGFGNRNAKPFLADQKEQLR